jgi:hypothetical protein
MDFFAHNESFESVVKGLKSDVNNGLSSEAAKQKLETEGCRLLGGSINFRLTGIL